MKMMSAEKCGFCGAGFGVAGALAALALASGCVVRVRPAEYEAYYQPPVVVHEQPVVVHERPVVVHRPVVTVPSRPPVVYQYYTVRLSNGHVEHYRIPHGTRPPRGFMRVTPQPHEQHLYRPYEAPKHAPAPLRPPQHPR